MKKGRPEERPVMLGAVVTYSPAPLLRRRAATDERLVVVQALPPGSDAGPDLQAATRLAAIGERLVVVQTRTPGPNPRLHPQALRRRGAGHRLVVVNRCPSGSDVRPDLHGVTPSR